MQKSQTFALGLLIGAAGAVGAAAQQTRGNFTVVNGQIYTPGLAILDSPQPNTPEGGDYLQIAIDVSGDGKLSQPQPPSPDVATGLYNITIFLTSYATGLNLTISNGTSYGWANGTEQPAAFTCPSNGAGDFQNAGCQEIMTQESGSTVKHVNWVWPQCLIGNSGAESNGPCGSSTPNVPECLSGDARGVYNISIHQSFRMNGSAYYTILNLPIDVSNSIPANTQHSSSGKRPICALLNNALLSPGTALQANTPLPFQPYLGGSVASGASGNTGQGNGQPSGAVALARHWSFTMWTFAAEFMVLSWF